MYKMYYVSNNATYTNLMKMGLNFKSEKGCEYEITDKRNK